MVFAYIGFFVLGVIVFFLMAKFGLPMRVAIALAVFVIPSVVLTVWVVRVGDKPPPDAITIVPKPGATPDKGGTSKDPRATK
jgi:hypothetical protein